MRGSGRALRATAGAVVFAAVLLLWFLLFSIVANNASDKAATRISSTRNLSILTLIASRSRYLPRRPPKYISVSKRRVPAGPDPIHNRRARSSRLPPS
ncbi:CLAVATA3/ESR (CLE)-related protein 25 [Coffea eugenioides]|uniref:CLAVATA3/ESR (CLE)-related protein 25 n=1 Tax=Coffea eugenioides TaxID=49369 RepID=UPI000F5D2C16|nr:CLAVATA3/ESR (CLE)-related protein 25-like [Coffea arabica]XP_027154535.1 CLAVATA3/ESR (CLE)-related protein 25 [Coffea eugenioides]